MKGFDYSSNNLYFVTCCVKNRECCFGNIVGTGRDLSLHDNDDDDDEKDNIPSSQMKLNKYGDIVNNQLLWLQEQYPYVVLHNHIVMPNHIHAVIEIDSNVGTGSDLSVQNEIKIKSLSQLMGAFKTTSSKLIHLAGYPLFEWQRSFHDHIIRNEKTYLNIMNYITTNPERWSNDTFNMIKVL